MGCIVISKLGLEQACEPNTNLAETGTLVAWWR
jgi:hypothetical protein